MLNSKISHLVSFLKKDFKNFKKFYENLLINLKKSVETNSAMFSEIFFDNIKRKIKNDSFWKKNKEKKLFGVPYTLKDNFLVNEFKTEASSNILKGYFGVADSHVKTLLEEEGALLIGKTSLDELGLGGTGLYAKEGVILNPLNEKHIIGGSSSGSAVGLMQNLFSFSIVSDTGDSARIIAAYGGFVGFKPSFGLISRFGLISYAPSFDTVSFITKKVSNILQIFNILNKFDKRDGSMQKLNKREEKKKKYKIGYIKLDNEFFDVKANEVFKKNVLNKLKEEGFKVEEISIKKEKINILLILYKILSFSEAISVQMNLTGINFGADESSPEMSFQKKVIHNRTKGLGAEVKRRYLVGSYFCKENFGFFIFKKAQKLRVEIINFFQRLFSKYDFVFHPASFSVATSLKEVKKTIKSPEFRKPVANDFLLLANFIGCPSLVMPYGKLNSLPLAINVFSSINEDLSLIKFCEKLEDILSFK